MSCHFVGPGRAWLSENRHKAMGDFLPAALTGVVGQLRVQDAGLVASKMPTGWFQLGSDGAGRGIPA